MHYEATSKHAEGKNLDDDDDDDDERRVGLIASAYLGWLERCDNNFLTGWRANRLPRRQHNPTMQYVCTKTRKRLRPRRVEFDVLQEQTANGRRMWCYILPMTTAGFTRHPTFYLRWRGSGATCRSTRVVYTGETGSWENIGCG